MLNTNFLAAGAVFILSASQALATPVTYDSITFPDGNISFADAVVSTDVPTGTNQAPTNANFTDPSQTLGAPDYVQLTSSNGTGAFSLGAGGGIVLEFIDNALTGSGTMAADLHIFEVGSDVEDTDVWISQDGLDFLSVGGVGGSTSSIDIDPFLVTAGLAADTKFFFVKLVDVFSEGQQTNSASGTVGADIDAVGAISTVAVAVVPLPAGLPLLLAGLGAIGFLTRRKT